MSKQTTPEKLMDAAYAATHMAADLAMEMDAMEGCFTVASAVELDRRCRDAACAALALKNKMLGHADPKRGD